MNLESMPSKAKTPPAMDEFDFDFRPITSGLGFHQPKPIAEAKSIPAERHIVHAPAPAKPLKPDLNVYQNDLSLFYNQHAQKVIPDEPKTEEKIIRTARRSQRTIAYVLDLGMVISVLAIVLTVMSRTIDMDLLEVWSTFPHEITPLVLTLFCGFYVIYFSVFEKSSTSTLGKNILGLKVVGTEGELLSFGKLMLRTIVSLLNFVSLGLFGYFDLQNKVTSSRVIRND